MDTGFASARVKIRDASPRSGLPPTFHSWEEFEGYTDALVAMGNIPDFSWFWWDVRPHPRHGTVELRVPDAQADAAYAVALAALTQCLVATAEDTPRRTPASSRRTSGVRSAAASTPGFTTSPRERRRGRARSPATSSPGLRPVSQDLGCEAELEGVLEILRRGTGADLQRAVYEKRGSLTDVVDYLLDTTAPSRETARGL
jgi:carboxylate-amine ligase